MTTTIADNAQSRPLTPDEFEVAAENILESADFVQRAILLDALGAAYRGGQEARDAEIERLREKCELLDAIKYAIPNLDHLAEMAGFEVERDNGIVRIGSRKRKP